MAVVVQPGFFIQVLTLEAQGVVGGAGVAVAVTGLGELAPGAVVADPGELSAGLAVAFCQLHRGAEVVGVDGREAVFELGGGQGALGLARPVPLELHRQTTAVGVAGDQMVLAPGV